MLAYGSQKSPSSCENLAKEAKCHLTEPARMIQVRESVGRGRGVFAIRKLAAATLLHLSDEPLVSVICSPYRKETCATCFAYYNGRKLKYSVAAKPSGAGVAWFCSEPCRDAWSVRHPQELLDTLVRIDALLARTCSGNQSKSTALSVNQDVDEAWSLAEGRKWKANELLPAAIDPDMLRYFLNGILFRLSSPERYDEELLPLAASSIAYKDALTLELDLATARFLHIFLPKAPFSTVRELRERDTGNSFGIRDDVGNELLGFATYALPTSGFNHSCEPNVCKVRQGTRWRFETVRDVKEGEELCISYLGTGEMDVEERQRRLQDGWGFQCACNRCKREMCH